MSPSPEYWKNEIKSGAVYEEWRSAKKVGYSQNRYHCLIETRLGELIGELTVHQVAGSGSIDIDISKNSQVGLENLRVLSVDLNKELNVREIYKKLGLRFGSGENGILNFSTNVIGETIFLAINRNLTEDEYNEREKLSENVSGDSKAKGLAKYFSEELKTKFVVSPITLREIQENFS